MSDATQFGNDKDNHGPGPVFEVDSLERRSRHVHGDLEVILAVGMKPGGNT